MSANEERPVPPTDSAPKGTFSSAGPNGQYEQYSPTGEEIDRENGIDGSGGSNTVPRL